MLVRVNRTIGDRKSRAADTPPKSARVNDRDSDRAERILSVFDLAQNIEDLWQGSHWEEERQILEIVSLNRHLSDVSLCIEKTKPFDVLAKRPVFVENRGDRI